MRRYAQVVPTFWTRGSGKKLKGEDDARLLALYLFTCPASNMIGLYYLPLPTIMHELGWDRMRFDDALRVLADLDIAHYDDEAELVWLPEGANYQIGPSLKPKDNVRKSVVRELEAFAQHRFGKGFLDRYETPYNLSDLVAEWIRDDPKNEGVGDPSERGPSCSVPVPEGGVGESGATGDERIDALADELMKHRKTRGVDPNPHEWAAELVGSLGPRALEVSPNDLRDAVRRGLPEIETGAAEGRVRKVMRWKVTDATKDAKREGKSETQSLSTRTEGGIDAWYARHTGRKP